MTFKRKPGAQPKPKKAKSTKKRKTLPNHRQIKFVESIASGMSERQAAIAANYSPSYIRNGAGRILRSIQENFQELVRKNIPAERLVLVLSDGLEATTTKVATFEGEITDQLELIDYAERRATVELVAKLGGYHVPVEKLETAGADRLDELLEAMQHGPVPRGEVNPEEPTEVPA